MVSVRILITPAFARMAYRLPNFPEDPYGFALEDRLQWSEPSIIYLVNNEDISFLSSLRFDDGEPIFNASELSHMEDVKGVVTGMRIALAIMMVVLLVVTIFAINNNWKSSLIKSLHQGGWVMIGLIVAIMLFVVLNFNNLFTWFHQIFFESGTWLFHPSDTLIRLFPMRFWRDAFLLVGLLSIILGSAVVIITRKYRLRD
jgi:integral membrane protein (TIGR01906 family)